MEVGEHFVLKIVRSNSSRYILGCICPLWRGKGKAFRFKGH